MPHLCYVTNMLYPTIFLMKIIKFCAEFQSFNHKIFGYYTLHYGRNLHGVIHMYAYSYDFALK